MMGSHAGETTVYCYGDVAVRMREVLARTWVGVCVLLALISWHPIHRNS